MVTIITKPDNTLVHLASGVNAALDFMCEKHKKKSVKVEIEGKKVSVNTETLYKHSKDIMRHLREHKYLMVRVSPRISYKLLRVYPNLPIQAL